jgi:L-malate glycosyltransferase
VPFIPRHIRAIEPYFDNEVWHIEIRQTTGKNTWTRKNLYADRSFVGQIRSRRWIFLEWLTFGAVLMAWISRNRSKRFELVNIHIAYPLAVHVRFLKWLFGVPLVFTEHWSAYHYSFNSTSRGLNRIRRIFHHDVPLICVSRSLAEDIERFSGRPQRYTIVDNVAETTVFHYRGDVQPQEGRFFAIAGWRFPKRPDVLLEAVATLAGSGTRIQLRLAGTGPKLSSMKKDVERLGLEQHVVFLGQLDPGRVAEEMRLAHALLHCSDHETYSAVCAEALCCGTPVIASDVGGIGEYMTSDTGILVPANAPSVWAGTIRAEWGALLGSDRKNISQYMMQRASTQVVGQRYAVFLERILDASNRKKERSCN